jgi:membrane-associated protease RseP (regulator of RpoE activity)
MKPATSGVWVQEVITPSPADSHGIMPGDFLTAINGVPVANTTSIHDNSAYKPGAIVNLTIWRQGKTILIPNVQLNASGALIGIEGGDLQSLVSTYSGSFLKDPALYLCIPTLPVCQSEVPFSDEMARFYTSPVGTLLPGIANLLYWLFFLNFNLAIFNALPIGPFDGGQAFGVGVKALSKGRLSEKGVRNVTLAMSFAVLALLLIVILGPYSGLF